MRTLCKSFFYIILILLLGISSSSWAKRKPESKIPATKVNSIVIFSNSPVYRDSKGASKPVISLNEGEKIFVSGSPKNNFINISVIKNGKKYSGWILLENISIPAEIASKLEPNDVPNTQHTKQENPQTQEKKIEPNEPPITRVIEKTYIPSKMKSFIKWRLDFSQATLDKQRDGVTQASSSTSKFGVLLDFDYGITQDSAFNIKLPYLFSEKTRDSAGGAVTSYSSKGFGDFELGFKWKVLNQIRLFDLLMILNYKSGFMNSDLPTTSKNGGAGSGSHDGSFSLISAKNFKYLSPYLEAKLTKLGSAKRHMADDSYITKYDGYYIWTFETGFDFPKFLPLFSFTPYLGYNYYTRHNLTLETNTPNTYEVNSHYTILPGLCFYLYQKALSFSFNYSYGITSTYANGTFEAKSPKEHKFSVTMRF